MKNHRFLWLRNRTTDNRKCEKARNIKEKRTIEMFSTDLKQLVEHLSSQNVNYLSSRDNQDHPLWMVFLFCVDIFYEITSILFTYFEFTKITKFF